MKKRSWIQTDIKQQYETTYNKWKRRKEMVISELRSLLFDVRYIKSNSTLKYTRGLNNWLASALL